MLWSFSARWLLLALALSFCVVEAAPERQAFLATGLTGASSGATRAHPLQSESSRGTGLAAVGAGMEADVQRVAFDQDNSNADDTASPTALVHEPSEHFESSGRRGSTTGVRTLVSTALAPDTNAPPVYEDSGTNQDANGGVEGQQGITTDELAKSPASSMLQVKQIIDQLLTGVMGTGLNLMRGSPAQAAAAPPALGPTPMYYQPPTETGLSTVEIVLIISGAMLALGSADCIDSFSAPPRAEDAPHAD
ncbi:hypothetical protein Esti_002771 [Eimeria stiedai]